MLSSASCRVRRQEAVARGYGSRGAWSAEVQGDDLAVFSSWVSSVIHPSGGRTVQKGGSCAA